MNFKSPPHPRFFFTVLIFFYLLVHRPDISKDIIGRHNWRQSQTMWNIRNFARHDGNILNPRVSHYNTPNGTNLYRYEFPIMQWAMGMSQKLVGENILFVRLFTFLITTIGLIGFYKMLVLIGINGWQALLGAYFYLWSPIIYYFSINPIPDNLALAASVWYLYFIKAYWSNSERRHLLSACLLLLLATLSKLPFLMFSIVSIYLFFKEFILSQKRNSKELIRYCLMHLILFLPALTWYLWVMPGWGGNDITRGIFANNMDHKMFRDILGYHISTMFPLRILYPSVLVFFILGIGTIRKERLRAGWIIALASVTFIYLALQFNTIGKDHDYYMMPFLPWMFVIVAIGLKPLIKSENVFKKAFLYIMILSAPIVSYITCKDFWTVEKSFFNKDAYTYQSELKSAVPNEAICIIANDRSKFIFSYLIDKMGYVFHDDQLQILWIEDMIMNKGAKYLYTDSRVIEEEEGFHKVIKRRIMERGSISVYELADLNER